MKLYFCRYDSPRVRITAFFAAKDDDEAAKRLVDEAMDNDFYMHVDDVEVTHIDVVDGFDVTLEGGWQG
jgi:hypothetical protein